MKLADDITANIARFAENERRCRRELMMQRTSLTGHSPARGRVLYEPRRVEGCRGKAVGGSTRIVVGGKVRVRLFRPLPSSWKAWQTHPPRRLNSNYRRNLPDHLSAATAATQAHHPGRSRARATRCAATFIRPSTPTPSNPRSRKSLAAARVSRNFDDDRQRACESQ